MTIRGMEISGKTDCNSIAPPELEEGIVDVSESLLRRPPMLPREIANTERTTLTTAYDLLRDTLLFAIMIP